MSKEKRGMRSLRIALGGCAASIAIVALTPSPAAAQSLGELQQRMNELESQMKTLKSQMQAAEDRASKAEKKAKAAARQASEGLNSSVKWHLGGYGSASALATDDSTANDTFVAGSFNPVFHFQYKDLVLFESELEFEADEDGATTTSLEYASIDLLLDDNTTFVAGKYLSPVGQFQERLHPAWVNKMPDAPAGFAHGGIQPTSDVGVMLRGGMKIDPVMLNYSVFAGNGPQVEYSAGTLSSVDFSGFGTDDNDNKATGGRVGILPLPYLEIGGSFMASQIEGRKETGVNGSVSEGNFSLWGADAAYTRGPWDVRFEYLSAQLDRFLSQQAPADGSTSRVPKTDWDAWYAQAAYKLSGLTDAPVAKNLELVGRYGEFDVDGYSEFVEHAKPEHRTSIGLDYYFAPTLIGKLAVSFRDYEDPDTEDATEGRAQIAFGF